MNQIEICNLALNHVGARSNIASLDEGSTEASTCQLHYEPALRAELRSFDWAFARDYISGTLIETTTEQAVPGWDYRYAYPAGIERVWAVVEDPRTVLSQKFRIGSRPDGGGVIYANLSPAWFRVTRSVTDPTFFDSLFVDAFAFKLASRLAIPLTRDTKIMSNMMQLHKQALMLAKEASANEDGPETTEDVSAPLGAPAWQRARGEVG